MGAQVFYSYSIYYEPIISSSWDVSVPSAPITSQWYNLTIQPALDNVAGLRGDIQIHRMWQRQTDTIIYFRVTDTDKKNYISSSLYSVMDIQEKYKNKNTYFPF